MWQLVQGVTAFFNPFFIVFWSKATVQWSNHQRSASQLIFCEEALIESFFCDSLKLKKPLKNHQTTKRCLFSGCFTPKRLRRPATSIRSNPTLMKTHHVLDRIASKLGLSKPTTRTWGIWCKKTRSFSMQRNCILNMENGWKWMFCEASGNCWNEHFVVEHFLGVKKGVHYLKNWSNLSSNGPAF